MRVNSWLRQIRLTTVLTAVQILAAKYPVAMAAAQDIQPTMANGRNDAVTAKPTLLRSPVQDEPVSVVQLQDVKLQIDVPEGFEDLDEPVRTLFDVHFQDKRIGLFEGTLHEGRFTFSDPAAVARKLPDVNTADVAAFLSEALSANENLRCIIGSNEPCGSLPVGISGIIVDPEKFRVDLFLGRDFLSSVPSREILLGKAVSGPSLIQNFSGSLSANTDANDDVRFGVALDTYASLRQTSLVSRLYGDDTQGLRWQELYAQNYFSDKRVAGGLVRDEGSLNLDSMSVYGVEVSSFDGRPASSDQSASTPVDIVLPRSARVEVYRSGTLVSALQYGAGLQVIDTSRLPVGSYPIRIIARDSSGIILDETRTFTKAPDLPPPGETVYSVRAGVRAMENLSLTGEEIERAKLLPESTGETVLSASVGRRLTRSSAGRLGVLLVDGEIYPEAELQLYRGELRASGAVAVGPDSQYSVVGNVNFQVGNVTSSISARKTEARPLEPGEVVNGAIYRPFLQSEETIYASLQTQVWDGALGLRASYSDSDLADERQALGVTYNRPFRNGLVGSGIIGFEALATDTDSRIGVRLTFRHGVGRRGSIIGAVGVDHYNFHEDTTDRSRTDPLARIGYYQSGTFGDVAVDGSIDAGTSNGESTLLLRGAASSQAGNFDISTGIVDPRDDEDAEGFLTSNVRTGFVYGGEKLKFGAQGFGDAAILVDVPQSDNIDDVPGRFRVVVDNQSGGTIEVGEAASVLVPSLSRAKVALVPEEAPPFDIDLTPRNVPLYPGNVVHMRWDASYVVSAFGRLIDREGNGIENAVVRSSTDLAVTSERGYFSISGKLDEVLSAHTSDGQSCGALPALRDPGERRNFVRLGDIVCDTLPVQGRQVSEAIADVPAYVPARDRTIADHAPPAPSGVNFEPSARERREAVPALNDIVASHYRDRLDGTDRLLFDEEIAWDPDMTPMQLTRFLNDRSLAQLIVSETMTARQAPEPPSETKAAGEPDAAAHPFYGNAAAYILPHSTGPARPVERKRADLAQPPFESWYPFVMDGATGPRGDAKSAATASASPPYRAGRLEVLPLQAQAMPAGNNQYYEKFTKIRN